MEKFGTLKIRSFFAHSRDEHGRETSGKWVTLLTRHCVTREDAKEVTREFHRANPKQIYFEAEFTIRENLTETMENDEGDQWSEARSEYFQSR